jgi:hypothetical protein
MADNRPLSTSVPSEADATRTERILAMLDVVVIEMMDYGRVELGTTHSMHLITARRLLRQQADEEEARARSGRKD